MHLKERGWQEPHELDGQVRLEFSDIAPLYVSWIQDKDDFHASYKNKRLFQTQLEEEKDMSNSETWKHLVGREINIAFHNKNAYILMIQSKNERVYCRSLGVDTITVARRLPENVI